MTALEPLRYDLYRMMMLRRAMGRGNPTVAIPKLFWTNPSHVDRSSLVLLDAVLVNPDVRVEEGLMRLIHGKRADGESCCVVMYYSLLAHIMEAFLLSSGKESRLLEIRKTVRRMVTDLIDRGAGGLVMYDFYPTAAFQGQVIGKLPHWYDTWNIINYLQNNEDVKEYVVKNLMGMVSNLLEAVAVAHFWIGQISQVYDYGAALIAAGFLPVPVNVIPDTT